MSATRNTNFRDLYFEHKSLTQIIGEPTFSTLHLMILQLKANASSVPSTLGDGQHGYIRVILSPVTYATLAHMQPFVPPVHPGVLQVDLPATQFEIALAKTLHDENVRTFQSYLLIQRALVQQVLEAIEPKYLSSLRNRITGQVPSEIRDLILHLFRVYGKITPQHLKSKYDAVEALNYSIDEPIDVIFSAVEDLLEIGELAGRPYSPQQIVDLGFLIISKQRIF